MSDDKTGRIRALNDAFRKTCMASGGRDRVVITAGIHALGGETVVEIMELVMRFDVFTPDNDPHGEHDFGRIEHAGQTIYFKIDYFDRDLVYGSEDPANPEKATRVMTVMLAEEY